ncbi:hypothetical protein VMCG_05345 [Cytospora schulzeri]|uniref:Alternative oxidase n=1 Tax=Cytospora schulzeri TaxID=448051 RepID=A0A423WK29_9PEZI|nr:hypothetical protein VMCG_05345 [Valsa malicola]
MSLWSSSHHGHMRRAIALIFIWAWVVLLFTQLDFHRSRHEIWASEWTRPASVEPDQAADIFAIPPLKSKAIKEVCRLTTWNENLVFTCNESYGGIGNIRNSVLHCIRYAIQAGASLVLPRIVLRSVYAIQDIETEQTADFSYMFDTQHFLKSIRLSCPQMKIHTSFDGILNTTNTGDSGGIVLSLKPESLVEGGVPRTGLPEPEVWREQFYLWLQGQVDVTESRPSTHTIINLQRSYMTYPVYSDGEEFALSFASILQFRNDTRVLATKVLKALMKQFSLHVDLDRDVFPNAFFGAHLRTEADSKFAWESAGDYWFYSHYQNQVEVFLKQAPRSNPTVIYVASGDLAEAARFANDAAKLPAPNNYTVVTKSNLLNGASLQALEALTFDQQALVDYLVLLEASDFAGVAHSSFAWCVALKRHQHARRKRDYLDAPEMLDDDLSKIYGTVKDFGDYPSVLWP